MTAFRAPEETDLALISSAELAEPPERKVVPALGALDLDRGHGLDVGIFIIHDRDLVLGAVLGLLHLVLAIDIPDIPAFAALKLTSGRHHKSLTFRTKHGYSMSYNRRLTLV